ATTMCSPPPRGGRVRSRQGRRGDARSPPPRAGEGAGPLHDRRRPCAALPRVGEGSEPPRQARGCSKPSPARGGGLGGGPPESARSPCRRFLRSRLANRPCRFLLPRTSPPGRGLAAGGGPGRAVLFQHALGQHHVLDRKSHV